MAPIDEALEHLESLQPGEKPNYQRVAKLYHCDRSTLSRRHRGVMGSKAAQYQQQRLLNDQQEKTLVKYIDELCGRGLPPSRQMIRNFAAEISRQEVGKEWVSRFLKRYQVELVSKWSVGLDHNRSRADSAFKYKLYFELMKRKIQQYNIEPRLQYNMDEKGFLIGVLSKMKRVFSRRRYEEGGIKQIVQSGNREWITLIAAICADGTKLTPALIYQAATGLIQDSWLQDFDPKLHQCFFTSSPSGWTNDKLGFQWLTQIFDQETKEKARRAWRLLILDGHSSHVNMRFIDYCDKNRILLALFPPHATHTVQPLDVCLFRPLSQAYSYELTAFMDDCQGISSITKRDFFRMFWEAWKTSFTKQNISSSFEATGLYPFNPDRVIDKFSNKDEDRPSSSSSTKTVIKAEDWKRIEKLLQHVVTDIYDKKAKQLSNTIHHLSTENMLLRMQNNGLKKHLVNEKKRRKRGKPLTLDFDAIADGGGRFYSPETVKHARDREEEKTSDIAAKRFQREVQKAQREAKKANKAQALEERKILRAKAKEAKELELAEKRRQKANDLQVKQANQQLQNELQSTAKKAKKPASYQKEADLPVIKDTVVVVEEEDPPPMNSRGRQIRLPHRFQPIR